MVISMELFYGVLLMLGAILLSNLLNRFLPSFSIPVIQIVLGVIISLLPSVYHFTLDPELFLILFLAPLLFHDGMHVDKKSLWDLKKPIIMLGLGLVFFTVLAAGYLINFMIPSIPLPAAFALAAALAPTDAVAVSSLGKRIKIPASIRNLLEGEALINDASGIVSFQFAVAAMVTGSFSLLHAGVEFLYVALGGVLVGAILTGFKYLIVKWVRTLGMENVTFHLLIGILTPLLIYMAAEELHVSGILAVVIAGVIHSVEGRRLNPELATLKIASQSVWSTLTFILNGLVFVILGMQFPEITNTIWYDISFDNLKIIGYILVITIAMMLIRFLWTYFIIAYEGKVEEGSDEKKLGRMKESLIISMSGVRGSVTLATTLSLPFFLNNKSQFPQRDLIIFLAAGVILLSLLIANFLLPLFFKEEGIVESDEEEREACLEIIENVIKQLKGLVDENNRVELGKVTRNYVLRAEELRNINFSRNRLAEEEIRLRDQVLDWEVENTKRLYETKEIDEKVITQYLQLISQIKERNTIKRRGFKVAFIKQSMRNFKRLKAIGQKKEILFANRMQIVKLRRLNSQYVLEKLYEKNKQEKTLSINKLIAEYERLEAMLMERRFNSDNQKEEIERRSNVDLSASEEQEAVSEAVELTDLVSLGFQMERDGIQSMFEQGRISRETVRKLRNNIALMELQVKNQDF